MRIAIDPYMHRHLSLAELPRKVAELGYDWIELSPRDDFLAWWVHPRAYVERIASFKKSLKDHRVKIASLLPMYRWASPHGDERQTAVRYWKKAIEIAVEMGVDTMNSEFGRGPSPDRPLSQLLRRTLHLQSSRREGHHPPTHGHRSGRGELGPVFLLASRSRL
jgi:myo-inositol catabolism protein IolH